MELFAKAISFSLHRIAACKVFLEATGACPQCLEAAPDSSVFTVHTCCISLANSDIQLRITILKFFFYTSHWQAPRVSLLTIRRSERLAEAKERAPAATEVHASGYLIWYQPWDCLANNSKSKTFHIQFSKNKRDNCILDLITFIQYSLKLARIRRSTYQSNTATKTSWR